MKIHVFKEEIRVLAGTIFEEIFKANNK